MRAVPATRRRLQRRRSHRPAWRAERVSRRASATCSRNLSAPPTPANAMATQPHYTRRGGRMGVQLARGRGVPADRKHRSTRSTGVQCVANGLRNPAPAGATTFPVRLRPPGCPRMGGPRPEQRRRPTAIGMGSAVSLRSLRRRAPRTSSPAPSGTSAPSSRLASATRAAQRAHQFEDLHAAAVGRGGHA